ncbi:hypothetical protein CXF86_03220 [Shewanella sp. GutCb]|uniref:DUF6404 family protein n=1 Tax=Shewanella sp. GutCb TaxID=2058315 RepID=UPI000C7B7B87|nr:DUF6404 family protein [Shewanella sp. GutCb]PKG76487.1 hypothetical protein CXF86_03220 [Shewanella sp. GutCb]
MSFQDKLEAAQKELSEANIWKSNHNPPISVLLIKLGFNIRPFHYCSFISNFITASLWFGSVWGLLMWFTSWQSSGMTIQAALIGSFFAGILFGLFMALYYKHSAKKNNLSHWHTL